MTVIGDSDQNIRGKFPIKTTWSKARSVKYLYLLLTFWRIIFVYPFVIED